MRMCASQILSVLVRYIPVKHPYDVDRYSGSLLFILRMVCFPHHFVTAVRFIRVFCDE